MKQDAQKGPGETAPAEAEAAAQRRDEESFRSACRRYARLSRRRRS